MERPPPPRGFQKFDATTGCLQKLKESRTVRQARTVARTTVRLTRIVLHELALVCPPLPYPQCLLTYPTHTCLPLPP